MRARKTYLCKKSIVTTTYEPCFSPEKYLGWPQYFCCISWEWEVVFPPLVPIRSGTRTNSNLIQSFHRYVMSPSCTWIAASHGKQVHGHPIVNLSIRRSNDSKMRSSSYSPLDYTRLNTFIIVFTREKKKHFIFL